MLTWAMPYAPHYRLTLSGVLGSALAPVEIFSFSLAIANPTSAVAGLVVPPAIVTACTNYFSRTKTHIMDVGVLTKIKYASLVQGALTGQTNTTGSGEAVVAVPGAAVSGASAMDPYQIAAVVSLNAATVSKTKKGRYYLPVPGGMSQATSTGRWAQFAVADIVDSSKQFINDLNIAAGNPVVVASAAIGNTTVTSIRVGDVPDTIRRRRNALVEQYTSTSIP